MRHLLHLAATWKPYLHRQYMQNENWDARFSVSIKLSLSVQTDAGRERRRNVSPYSLGQSSPEPVPFKAATGRYSNCRGDRRHEGFQDCCCGTFWRLDEGDCTKKRWDHSRDKVKTTSYGGWRLQGLQDLNQPDTWRLRHTETCPETVSLPLKHVETCGNMLKPKPQIALLSHCRTCPPTLSKPLGRSGQVMVELHEFCEILVEFLYWVRWC